MKGPAMPGLFISATGLFLSATLFNRTCRCG
jgi:hypothetical protein